MPKFLISIILPVLLSLGACAVQSPTQLAANDPPPLGDHLPLAVFYDLMADDEDVAAEALERIKENWKDAYAVMLLDMIYFSTSDRIDAAMTRALQQASGIPFNCSVTINLAGRRQLTWPLFEAKVAGIFATERCVNVRQADHRRAGQVLHEQQKATAHAGAGECQGGHL